VRIASERQEQISLLVYLGYQKSSVELTEEENQFWDVRFKRYAAAANLSTPFSTLAELAQDRDKNLRRIVASNRSTPIPILTELAQDEDGKLRRAIAGNTSTPHSVLKDLCHDQDHDVATYALNNPIFSLGDRLEFLEDDDYLLRLRAGLSLAESETPMILTLLVQNSASSVREAVAINPSTPLKTISVLVQDKNLGVLEALLQENENLTDDQRREVLSKASAMRRQRPDHTILNPNVHERSWEKY